MPKDTKENNIDNDHDDNYVDVSGNIDKCSTIENEVPITSYTKNNSHIHADNDDSNESYDDDDAGGKCILETFQRVRFFPGQLLTSEDLNQLTRYFNNKRLLINRQIIGTNGIVCGLCVNNVNYIQGFLNIDISNGFAIDCCGKEIIIARQITHKLEFPRQFFNEKIKRFGLFVSHNDIKHSASVVNSLHITCENPEEPSSMETRIEEGYVISLKPFENNLLGIEFNKKNYCITDKVFMEVWDPDNTLRAHKDKVIKVTSSNGQSAIVIKLKKLGSSDFYRGEMLLSEKKSIDYVQLKVNKIDTITASLDEQIREKAFVSSEDSFIYNQRQNIDNSFEYQCREYNNCDIQLSNSLFNKNSKDVLIAVIKKDYQARKGDEGKVKCDVFLDKEESLLCRNIIYNNQMLYDLSTNRLNCNDPTETDSDKTIFISKTETYPINDIEPGDLKVMEPIKILDNDDQFANEELEFPPQIYLGRVSHENKTNETVLFNEDMCCNSEGKIVIDGESFDSPRTYDNEIKSILENLKKEKDNLIFKPIDIRIKEKSFRIILANPSRRISHSSKDEKSTKKDSDNDSSDTAGDKKEKEITLRWWATCKFKRLV